MPFDDQGGRGPNIKLMTWYLNSPLWIILIMSYLHILQDGTPPKVSCSLSPIGSFHTSGGSDLPVVVVKILNFLKKEQQVWISKPSDCLGSALKQGFHFWGDGTIQVAQYIPSLKKNDFPYSISSLGIYFILFLPGTTVKSSDRK